MGRKINPKIFRIPLINDWQSKWFAKRNKYRQYLQEDLKIRDFLNGKLKNCAIAKIIVERLAKTLRVVIYTAKPGLIIGRGGVDIEKLKKEIKKKFLNKDINFDLSVKEQKNPGLSAAIVLEQVILELEKRAHFRKTLKRTIRQIKNARAKGAKIKLSGRLGGAEIARSEKLTWGTLPLHTLRADIDYAHGVARTTYGAIGVKIWIYRGDYFNNANQKKKEINN